MRPSRILFALLIILPVPGCRPAPPAPPQLPPPDVTVAQPIEQELPDYKEFTGRIEAVETVEVRPRVSGFIQKVNFTEGREIKAGDVLFEIDPRPFKAAHDAAMGDLAVAKAQLQKALVDFNRIQELSRSQDASPIELDRTAADKAAGEAAVAAAQAKVDEAALQLEWTRVTAPISGRISRAIVTAGNLVTGGMSLAPALTTIVSVDPVHAYFDVDERTVLQIQQLMRAGKFKGVPDGAVVPVELALGIDTDYVHKGVLDFVDNRINPDTGTLQVRGVFENKERILAPGLFFRARVVCGEPQRGVAVTERAIGADQNQRFVFVVDAQNKVQYRRVEAGLLRDGMRMILSGLTRDDWVVVNGLQRVRPGAAVNPRRSEMAANGGNAARRAIAGDPAAPAASGSDAPASRPAAR